MNFVDLCGDPSSNTLISTLPEQNELHAVIGGGSLSYFFEDYLDEMSVSAGTDICGQKTHNLYEYVNEVVVNPTFVSIEIQQSGTLLNMTYGTELETGRGTHEVHINVSLAEPYSDTNNNESKVNITFH